MVVSFAVDRWTHHRIESPSTHVGSPRLWSLADVDPNPTLLDLRRVGDRWWPQRRPVASTVGDLAVGVPRDRDVRAVARREPVAASACRARMAVRCGVD